MKRTLCILLTVLLAALSPIACGKDRQQTATASVEGSGIWKLPDRYSSTYTALYFNATYTIDGEPFVLRINRNKKTDDKTRTVKTSKEADGLTYALCESKQQDDNGNPLFTYYETYTGAFHYYMCREAEGFNIEDCLGMDEAIRLMQSPLSPSGRIQLNNVFWDAYFRLDGCNLNADIRPNDGGAMIASLGSDFAAQQDGAETWYLSSHGDEIAYTDGTNSVRIRQSNRAGQSPENYLTLEECKDILALL